MGDKLTTKKRFWKVLKCLQIRKTKHRIEPCEEHCREDKFRAIKLPEKNANTRRQWRLERRWKIRQADTDMSLASHRGSWRTERKQKNKSLWKQKIGQLSWNKKTWMWSRKTLQGIIKHDENPQAICWSYWTSRVVETSHRHLGRKSWFLQTQR